jgi:ABC-type glycerol-3-phosphate transport system permease component
LLPGVESVIPEKISLVPTTLRVHELGHVHSSWRVWLPL